MNSQQTLLAEAVEREINRKTYPPGFPSLPDLPSGRYFDPGFFKLEMENVWHKTWISAAHVSELPKEGAYKLFEQLGLSIIISRGTDNEIRAFRNVCRHRGAALLTEPAGTARRFVCPYHAWGYTTEGKLVSVPEAHNFDCLDKSTLPLMQVRAETWRGFIFINLNNDAEPLADFIAPLAAQVGDFPLEDMAVKNTVVTELECNWKTAYDNFLEIYHVNTVHARTIAPFLQSNSFTISLLPHGHARFTTRKPQTGSMFAKTEEANSLTGDFSNYTIGLPRFPNGFTAFDPGGFNWMNFWPVTPTKMLMVSTFLGRTMGNEEEDRIYWENFTIFQKQILAEDVGLFPSVQRAMMTGELTGLKLSYQEQQLHWYHEEIDRKIGPDNIPPHLRVTPLLAKFAHG